MLTRFLITDRSYPAVGLQYLVENAGFEPAPTTCKAVVLPLTLIPHNLETATGIEPGYTALQTVAFPLCHAAIKIGVPDENRTRSPWVKATYATITSPELIWQVMKESNLPLGIWNPVFNRLNDL